MTRGLAVPPPARPSWPDATLYEVRPHQESCIMVPRSGDPLQERSGRLEKMSFAAPWRSADNMGLHGGRQARTVASRRAPYLRTRPQCLRARTPNARSPRAPPRRVARGVDAPAPHRHAIGPGRRRTGGQAPGATVTPPSPGPLLSLRRVTYRKAFSVDSSYRYDCPCSLQSELTRYLSFLLFSSMSKHSTNPS